MYGIAPQTTFEILAAHEQDVVLVDGTHALTADWDAGSFQIRAETFQSDITTGTAPLIVASTTVVTNLNADLLDGEDWDDQPFKDPVRVATTADITLSGEQTIDGVSAVTGDRVLVKDQSTASENGIYVCDSSTWTRATDFASGAGVAGSFGVIQEGTANADDFWICTSDSGSDVVATDNLAFVVGDALFPGPGSSTDNAVVRWDGTGGDLLQNSGVLITDTGEILVPGSSNPQYSFVGDTSTGFRRTASGQVVFRSSGSDGFYLGPNGVAVTGSYKQISLPSLASDVTTEVDWNDGNIQIIDLNDSPTLTFVAPSVSGGGGNYPAKLTLIIRQDAMGSRTITWPGSVDWPGGSAPTLSTGANDVDILEFVWNGTTAYFGNTFGLNFS